MNIPASVLNVFLALFVLTLSLVVVSVFLPDAIKVANKVFELFINFLDLIVAT